ncbi:hypothetical protein B0H16DRAFT_1896342 [Mycena metata]|uniref:Uncharacterized protein n=1 Tax=Mycena metata TaxID=1033252 RepID=A0AAD7HKB4_9AGAR|nr:hypothetical protein B0H16DRAFT_1896342 [Mycena metata]
MPNPRGAAASGARGRGRGRGRGGTRGQPAKRAAPDSDYEENPAAKKQKQAVSTTPADAPTAPEDTTTGPRSHLGREKKAARYRDAEADILPRAKRTSAQVQTEADALAAARAELARQHIEAIAKVAELTAAQDKLAAEEEKNRVLTLDDDYDSGDELSADQDEPMLHISQEDFDRIEDEEAYRSANEFEDKPKKNPTTKRMKKPARGETRATVNAAVVALAEADKVAKKKGVQNADAAGASAKAGLSKCWTSVSSKAPQIHPPTSPKLGGLDDDDAAATRPTTNDAKTVRANKMVAINLDVSSDDDEETPSRILDRPVKAPRPRIKAEPTSAKLAPLRVKATPKAGIKTESSGTFNFTPPSHADVKNLPAFIAPTWTTKFLQGCYVALLKVPKPMSFATAVDAQVTVDILQGVLDDYYPGCGWELRWGDAICTKAVARLGERRGLFGRAGVNAVDEEFKQFKYFGPLDGPKDERGVRLLDKTQADAKYALRFNGPAFFKTPTPELHTLTPMHKDYIKPAGFLESRPFIASVKPYIKGGKFRIVLQPNGDVDLQQSVLPFGGLVMGAVSIERGYKLHLTGDRLQNSVPDFSATVYANAAAGYLKAIRKMSAKRWESILTACDAGTTAEEAAAAASGLDTLDGAREEMYLPSSP